MSDQCLSKYIMVVWSETGLPRLSWFDIKLRSQTFIYVVS